MTYYRDCYPNSTMGAIQDLLILADHLRLPSGIMYLIQIFSFLCNAWQIIVLHLMAIVLSVLQFTVSGYPFGILDLRFLVTPLVSQIYGFWLPLQYLRFTVSGYPFIILDLRIRVTPLVSQIYGFWLPLQYLRFTFSGYLFSILDLHLLITPLVSSIFSYRVTPSGHPFGIFNLFLQIDAFWSPLW